MLARSSPVVSATRLVNFPAAAGVAEDAASAASAAVLPSRQVFRKSLRGVKQSVVITKLGSIVAIGMDDIFVERLWGLHHSLECRTPPAVCLA